MYSLSIDLFLVMLCCITTTLQGFVRKVHHIQRSNHNRWCGAGTHVPYPSSEMGFRGHSSIDPPNVPPIRWSSVVVTNSSVGGKNSYSQPNVPLTALRNAATIVATVIGIRSFILEPMYIPSLSMFPTFQIGDQLLVNKVEHWFRGKYQRNDVVVFRPTELHQLLTPTSGWFIKRIVALPGDIVEIKDGYLYVNDVMASEKFVLHKIAYQLPRTVVPANKYFVLGDNRNDSFDSHVWGFLPGENVVGRAVCKYWPWKRAGPIER